ncbi:MAG TPA: TIGR02281 family clan AA aspartic protease [Ramlibacter sp.]|nr:TIGR02281 family clan AA aspartic protease [Ramlibacter sp.]
MIKFFLACVALAACTSAWSQVALQGMMGRKALLIIDGAAPRLLAPGETHQGVKVISTTGDQALLEIDGKRYTLRVGEAPASVGAGAGASTRGSRIVLTVDRGGHFFSQGSINGQAVNFMVDTGATSVSIGVPDAERLGINYKAGELGRSSTANGVINTWRVKLKSVRIGDVEVFDVDASVTSRSSTSMRRCCPQACRSCSWATAS